MPYLRLALASTLAVACLAPSMSSAQIDRPKADGFKTTTGTGDSRASACLNAKSWQQAGTTYVGEKILIGDDGCKCHKDEVDETNIFAKPWTCQTTYYWKYR